MRLGTPTDSGPAPGVELGGLGLACSGSVGLAAEGLGLSSLRDGSGVLGPDSGWKEFLFGGAGGTSKWGARISGNLGMTLKEGGGGNIGRGAFGVGTRTTFGWGLAGAACSVVSIAAF